MTSTKIQTMDLHECFDEKFLKFRRYMSGRSNKIRFSMRQHLVRLCSHSAFVSPLRPQRRPAAAYACCITGPPATAAAGHCCSSVRRHTNRRQPATAHVGPSPLQGTERWRRWRRWRRRPVAVAAAAARCSSSTSVACVAARSRTGPL